MTDPRYLTAAQGASYLSVSRSTFDLLVARGTLPAPIAFTERVKRWDREALDAAASALAGAGPRVQRSRSADEIVRGIADGIAERRAARPQAAARRH